jgi:hypothetical protein
VIFVAGGRKEKEREKGISARKSRSKTQLELGSRPQMDNPVADPARQPLLNQEEESIDFGDEPVRFIHLNFIVLSLH